MSVKKKIAISVSVILVVAIIVAVIVIAWVMSGLCFAKTGGQMDGVSYEYTRKYREFRKKMEQENKKK